MKKLFLIIIILTQQYTYAQKAEEILIPVGLAALSFIAADANKKELAKEISQFRSKEYIVDYIIGPIEDNEIEFETESLASDNSAGLISVALIMTK
jgi:hypothetical protein